MEDAIRVTIQVNAGVLPGHPLKMINQLKQTNMDIKQTMQEIHSNNREKGFWDKERNTGEMLMLVVSELSEALEADRKDKRADLDSFGLKTWTNQVDGRTMTNEEMDARFKKVFADTVKDGFEDELADAVIRLFDIAEGMKIDLEWHIRAKMRYNSMREKMHGKAY